jgi:hypothetical protein
MGNLAFYEASAQVIPILFIVLAVEWRAFEFQRLRGDRYLAWFFILVSAMGEAGALHALYRGSATRLDLNLVVSAYGLLGTIIVVIAGLGRPK